MLLAGTSLALSSEKRRGQPGQTAFIVKRGLLIAALDPIWMSLGFAGYRIAIFQVLYAIGLSLVCMAFLRRLSSRALLALAVAIQLFGELQRARALRRAAAARAVVASCSSAARRSPGRSSPIRWCPGCRS